MEPRLPHNIQMMTNETIRLYPHDYLLKYTVVPLVPRFVKPNHITVFRMIATPFVLWLLYIQNYQWGVPVFIFVACTDALDGSVARLRKEITVWGTFFDPLADKILMGSVFILIVMQHINILFGLLLLMVEVVIGLGGLYRRMKGLPILTANIYGKTKMVLQVIGVTFLLLALGHGIKLFIPFSIGTFSLALVFALMSLWTYGL